jgi:predicted transporter
MRSVRMVAAVLTDATVVGIGDQVRCGFADVTGRDVLGVAGLVNVQLVAVAGQVPPR